MSVPTKFIAIKHLRLRPEQTLQFQDESPVRRSCAGQVHHERREQRAKALADQEAQPTLFTDLK
jgi:hypothetical protein